jgi:hypothetical protein
MNHYLYARVFDDSVTWSRNESIMAVLGLIAKHEPYFTLVLQYQKRCSTLINKFGFGD